MARLPRLYIPGMPQLIYQRGNDGNAIVRDDEDRARLLEALRDAAREQGVSLHAYVLLPERFRLLATPRDERAIGKMLQSVGRRYVAYFNQRHGRTGTLWEGRYRATVLDPADFLLPAMRDIETNPVRGNLVEGDPAAYRWSSCAHHVGLRSDPLVADHPVYWALGNTPFERQGAYRALLDEPLRQSEIARLNDACAKGWILAADAFVGRHGALMSRRPRAATRGRPRIRS